MFDVYDRQEIEDHIHTYAQHNFPASYKEEEDIYEKMRKTGVADVDGYIQNYEKRTLVDVSHKEFISSLLVYKKLFERQENEHYDNIVIVNELIGNRRLFDKIKFCTDGSFRNNRIWISCNSRNGDLDIYIRDMGGLDYHSHDKYMKMSPRRIKRLKRSLRLMFNKYPIVFCQFKTGSESDIINYVDYQRKIYDYDMWDDIY